MTATGTKISKRVEKELHQNKVIIRRLPPDITEERFRELINPFPEHTYFYLAPGDHTLGPLGCSRAYIAFEDEEEIVAFRDQYDGMLLESEKGGKYRAIVEFAPYQGIPKKPKRKQDARCGTIDKDSDFQLFMQSLENRPEPRPSISLETYLEELEANRIQDVQVTPLIEYLRERTSGRSGRSRGRMDVKKKRKGGESSSSKCKRSSKSADSVDSSTVKGSKSRESSSSKGRKEKRESESTSRTGASTKLAASSTQQEDGESSSRNGSSHRSASGGTDGRQERKEKYRGGSERREGSDAIGEKDSRKGRQRNRDRPDRSIYVPRGRDQGSGGREREGKERENSRDYPSRGGRGRQGRHDDSGDYRGRPRSRGRGRGYRRSSDQHHDSGYQDK